MSAALTMLPVLRPVHEPAAPDVPDDALSTDELGARIVGLAGRLAAATCRWLLLVARFDAADGAARSCLPSTARWLSHTCGLAHRTAVEHVRVARALAEFAALADEMSCGRLSYSQVRAISRVPKPGEHQVVADLIEVARHGSASQLESVVRGLRTVDDTDDPPTEEYLTSSWNDESQWRCRARLAPEDGAVVAAAIDAVARTEKLSRPQALVRMAEIALAAVNDAAGPTPGVLRGDERAAIVVHLDAAAVGFPDGDQVADPTDSDRSAGAASASDLVQATDTVEAADAPRSAECAVAPRPGCTGPRLRSEQPASAHRWPFARIADGPGLPARVVERLLCAGRIRTAVHDRHGNVRDLGRSHRVVDERLFRAVQLRDGGCCAFPGCGSRTALEAHHVRHWLHGGRTDLGNLVLLCKAHHLGHHNAEFGIAPSASGSFAFVRADGRVLPARVDPALAAAAVPTVDVGHADVADDASCTLWTGDHLDRRYAVAVLAERRPGEGRPTESLPEEHLDG